MSGLDSSALLWIAFIWATVGISTAIAALWLAFNPYQEVQDIFLEATEKGIPMPKATVQNHRFRCGVDPNL